MNRGRWAFVLVCLMCASACGAGAAPRPTVGPSAPVGVLSPSPDFGQTSRLVADFSPETWGQWDNVTYFPWSPKNRYSRQAEPMMGSVLKATSDGAGSMFLRFVNLDPRETPIVSWSWRITAPVAYADERTRGGDDAAARVYFIWKLQNRRDLFTARALGYIWGRTRQPGEMGRSPFTDQIGIVALRAGVAGAGRWQVERRDLISDYQRIFREVPTGPVSAVAILTDTDQTRTRTTSWYAAIRAEAR